MVFHIEHLRVRRTAALGLTLITGAFVLLANLFAAL